MLTTTSRVKRQRKKEAVMNKNTGRYAGHQCSGYGVFPGGQACKGCDDCGGKFVSKPATKRQLTIIVNRNHTSIKISGRKANIVKK